MLKSIIVGLQIFDKYDGDMGVGHDQIWCGPSHVYEESPLTAEEIKELEENDWWFDNELDCWSHFV